MAAPRVHQTLHSLLLLTDVSLHAWLPALVMRLLLLACISLPACLPAYLLPRLQRRPPTPSDKYKKSQRTAAGADKWLDTRLWDSTADCLGALKAAGYQVVTTHLAASSITIQVGDWRRFGVLNRSCRRCMDTS
jgi:hypothetical protein